jgi:hypothetical protein
MMGPVIVVFCMIGAPSATSDRATNAIRTGMPTTSAMNTVRRDQSMSPSERSNTRSAA